MSTTTNSVATTVQTPLQTPTGNIQAHYLLAVPLAPAIVATITTAEQIFAVAGLLVGDMVSVSKPSLDAGVAVTSARVSSAGHLAITYANPTAAGVTPATETYQVEVLRPIAQALTNGLPASLPTS